MSAIELEVQNERVKALYLHSNTSLLGLLMLSIAVFYYFWGKVEQELIVLWFTALLITFTARIVLSWRFKKISNTDFSATKWNWLFTLGSVLSATILGSSAPLFIDFSAPNSAIFLTLVMSGTVAGAMAALSSFLPAFYLFSLVCLAPLAYQFYDQGGELYIFSVFITLFLIMYSSYARNMHATLTTSIRQRFENINLLEKLSEQTRIAEQASNDKSRFLAATSHDLRQPLHSLGLFLHVLKKKLGTPEQKQLMKQAEKSQRVLSEQLNSIIDITRIDAGELQVKKHPFQLEKFINDVVSEFSLSAKKVNCKIRTQVTNDWTNTDEVLLARVVRNFISNVIQHCPDSTLIIESRLHEDYIELLFTDDGLGLVETDQEIIFSEFYQINNPERDRNKGLGLGLSIVKRLTELLNMNLKLESEKGKGSTFSITLPLLISVPPTVSTDTKNKTENKPDVAGLFIVVVDDEKENLDAMRALLTLWECETLIASNEDELMKEFRSADYPVPDMLLIDYRLREERTGFELIEVVRHYFGIVIPAAIITGDTTIDLENRHTTDDCRVLYKPLSSEDLKKLLSRESQ
ncbi:MAG: hybrid sensor histidine kinase/response regulator [Gammaproteobacteria bacterium]|nr:hybrid sensor histidine kinase/response regulator [Gammaproteobacteria bacterium]